VRTGCYCGLFLAAGLGLGCARTPAGSTPVPVAASVDQSPAPDPQPAPPAPAASQPAVENPFHFPDDAGGRQVARALSPPAPPAPPLPGPAAPKPRTSSLDRGELPLPAVVPGLPKAPPVRSKSPRPSPPPESYTAEPARTVSGDATLARMTSPPLVRGPASPVPSAADLPPLARPAADRASLDDPTAGIATARAVLTALPLPSIHAPFLRLGIPDPFEFATQLRGKIGLEGELGTSPVNVPPGTLAGPASSR
jgi:hypothetical protein